MVVVQHASSAITRRAAAAVRPQRLGVVFVLFVLWLLAIPFHRYPVYETYSLDNLMAPVLMLLALFQPRLAHGAHQAARMRGLAALVLIYFLYSLATVLPLMSETSLLMQKSWLALRTGFYFVLPLLFIRDARGFRIVKTTIVIMAMIACISALLAALGMVQFEVTRFAQSRLGMDWLPKSIGLFSSYGDVAILCGLTAVFLVSHKSGELGLFLASKLGKLIVVAVLILGLLGNQSRNIVLSIFAGVGAYWFLGTIRSSRQAATGGLLVLSAMMVLTAVLLFFSGDIVSGISQVGGEKAEATALGRLDSYRESFRIFSQSPLIGATPDIYRQHAYLVEGVHNMWIKVALRGGMLALFFMGTLFLMGFLGAARALYDERTARDARVAGAGIFVLLMATQFYGGLSDTFWVALGFCLSLRLASTQGWKLG